MSENRWETISDSLRVDESTSLIGERIVRVAGELFTSLSNSVTVWSSPMFLSLANSDERARHLDQKQLIFGEGPIFDVAEADSPVYTADVGGRDCSQRWPHLCSELMSNKVESVLCFPLSVGSAHLGAVTAYRDISGAPSADMYRDGLILASLATEELLHLRAQADDTSVIVDFEYALENDAVLQQAAGMVSEHFNISIADAMVLIRSKAFSSNYSLNELSRIIVRRELSLEEW